MRAFTIAIALNVSATALLAEGSRELDAHVHGVTEVRIAVEAGEIEIELEAPGADIVGFEHAPSNDADKAAVDAALAVLRDPASVVTLPAAAGCTLEEAEAALLMDEHHDEEEHGDHEEHEDDHGHGHDDHADDHGHNDHNDEHEDHAEAIHSAFEAHYHFECTAPDALTSVSFPYFASFPNAEEIEAEYVTDAGAGAAEVTADAPDLTLN